MTTHRKLQLGGEDIDDALVNYIVSDCKSRGINLDVTNDKLRKRLRLICKRAKKQLTKFTSTRIDIEFISLGRHYGLKLLRPKFEEIVRPILEKTLRAIKICMFRSNLTKNDVDTVVLVGGSARIPLVQSLLADFFGSGKINCPNNPAVQVVNGAIVYASKLN